MTALPAWIRIPAINPLRKSLVLRAPPAARTKRSGISLTSCRSCLVSPCSHASSYRLGVVCRVQYAGHVLVGQDCLQHLADEQDLCGAGVQPRRLAPAPAVAWARPPSVAGFLTVAGVVYCHGLVATPAGDQPVQRRLGRGWWRRPGALLSPRPGGCPTAIQNLMQPDTPAWPDPRTPPRILLTLHRPLPAWPVLQGLRVLHREAQTRPFQDSAPRSGPFRAELHSCHIATCVPKG